MNTFHHHFVSSFNFNSKLCQSLDLSLFEDLTRQMQKSVWDATNACQKLLISIITGWFKVNLTNSLLANDRTTNTNNTNVLTNDSNRDKSSNCSDVRIDLNGLCKLLESLNCLQVNLFIEFEYGCLTIIN